MYVWVFEVKWQEKNSLVVHAICGHKYTTAPVPVPIAAEEEDCGTHTNTVTKLAMSGIWGKERHKINLRYFL